MNYSQKTKQKARGMVVLHTYSFSKRQTKMGMVKQQYKNSISSTPASDRNTNKYCAKFSTERSKLQSALDIQSKSSTAFIFQCIRVILNLLLSEQSQLFNYFSYDSHNIVEMSKYKTPIRIQLDTTKKVNEKTTKYRLPFQKEQLPHHSTRKLDTHSLIISQQMQPSHINPKDTAAEKQSEKSEPEINQFKAETVLKKHEERQVINQLQTQSILEVPMPIAERQQHQTQTMQKLQIVEVKQVEKHNQETQVETQVKQQVIIKRVESKLSIDRSHQLKLEPVPPQINREPIQPKLPETILKPQNNIEPIESKKFEPLQLKSNSFYRKLDESFAERRVKYNSSTNRYADEEHYADVSRQSDMDASTFLNTNARVMPKIIRRTKQAKPIHSSLKKAERQVWQILSGCTQKQQQVDLLTKHHRRSKSKLKPKKSRQSQSELKYKSKAMLQKLNAVSEHKTEEQMLSNINYDIYDDLPPINEDSQISRISKEEHDSIIQKLHSLIDLKQPAKKQKTVVALQKYCKQYELIHKINPFFKKLDQFAGCILLSVGKIKFINAADLIFTEGEPISHLSIIILGKVLLTKAFNQYRNFGLPGESLGQEALFDESKPYHLRLANSSKSIFYRSQARAHTKVCILRISLRKFYKMSIQLNSTGEKRLFNMIDNLFKINYLKKNALLHQQLKQRLQTEILVTRRKRKGSLYFH